MVTRNGFTLMTIDEFEQWMAARQVTRTVLTLQQHHTFSPSYANFTGSNHFSLLVGMKNYHVNYNGWADIGQHFTTFPDGMIATGRSLELSPACIKGRNANAICVENVGYFDAGKDNMTAAHRDVIVRSAAAIVKRFGLPVNTDRIVYHHWFDLNTGARTNGNSGSVKSCPGTAFFGGNKVAHAQANFLPLVTRALGGHFGGQLTGVLKFGYVTAQSLNIRTGPGTQFSRVGATSLGAILRIYRVQNGWYKIAKNREEWVAGNFVTDVQMAEVANADRLNVRSGPGTSFSIVGTYLRGEVVFIFEQKGTWAKIGLDERWVSRNFLKIL
ncbi:MAG: SH3 domain-containing protein [Saprospiraceae bacterium]|nr:SH3 domain-containing protein [Saprospiraceae bacterium]